MSDTIKNTRASNLAYARWLKANNFPTAVHALTQELRNVVDELLSKGWKGEKVAKEINAILGQQKKTGSLFYPKISRSSINNYRDKYWKKTPAYANLILSGNNDTKNDIEAVTKQYDAFKEAIKLAVFASERVKWLRSKEAENNLPTDNGNTIIKQAYDIHKGNFEMEIQLGVRKRVPPEKLFVEIQENITKSENENKPDDVRSMLSELKEIVEAIEGKGKYGPPTRFTGEWLGPEKPPFETSK